MRSRRRIRMKTSKRIFRRGVRVHKKNRPRIMRGGIRE